MNDLGIWGYLLSGKSSCSCMRTGSIAIRSSWLSLVSLMSMSHMSDVTQGGLMMWALSMLSLREIWATDLDSFKKQHPSTMCKFSVWLLIICVYSPWCVCTCMDKPDSVYNYICTQTSQTICTCGSAHMCKAIVRAKVVTSSWSWKIQILFRNRWGFDCSSETMVVSKDSIHM